MSHTIDSTITPISRPDNSIRQIIQSTIAELSTELKTFIREEISESFHRYEIKDQFVVLNLEENERVSIEFDIISKIMSLAKYSPGSFIIIGRIGNPKSTTRPILCSMNAGFRLPYFKDLAQKLKNTPDLAHLNVRRAETPKQRREGFIRRQEARQRDQTTDEPMTSSPPSTPQAIEEPRETQTEQLSPTPQLPQTPRELAEADELSICEQYGITLMQKKHCDRVAKVMAKKNNPVAELNVRHMLYKTGLSQPKSN